MTYQDSNIEFQPKPTIHNFVDLEGQTFGRLTVLGYAGTTSRRAMWWCRCICKTITKVSRNHLRSGHTQSCNCLRHQPSVRKTHGMKETPEYNIYILAKGRCTNPNRTEYDRYGGRGIEFRFDSFEEFLAEIGLRPSKQYSLERIDNEGHYAKGNVMWATRIQQANNKRSNIRLTFNGETRTIMEWCRLLSLTYSRVVYRWRHGWTDADALTIPSGVCRKYHSNSPQP